jgi:predicted tellurium resistance membrane protein TerC
MFPKNLDSLYTARVLTIGAAVATVFGTYWVASGINATQVPFWFKFALSAALATFALSMAVGSIRLFTSANLFPPIGDKRGIRQANRYINIATVIQVVASIVAPVLLARWGHAGLGFPAVIVTVGLYLVAFGPLLRISHYLLVGGLLTVVPIISVLLMPETISLLGGTIQTWTALDGLACGLIYLAFGCANMLLAIRIRRGQYHQNRRYQGLTVQRARA